MALSPLWFIGWRAMVLLVMSVAPWAVPPDVPPPSSADAALGQLLVGSLGVGLLGFMVAHRSRTVRRDPLGWSVAATLVAAVAASAALPTDRTPLGIGMLATAPLAWVVVTLAVLRHAPPRPGVRLGVVALIAVFALGGAVVSWPRIRTREAMWQAAAIAMPRHEGAHLGLVRLLTERRVANGEIRRGLDRCVGAAPAATRCRRARALVALAQGDDSQADSDAARVLERDADDGEMVMVRARVLSTSRQGSDEACNAARRAVELRPDDGAPRVLLALCHDARGSVEPARSALRAAVERGAGGFDLALLETSLALRAGDLSVARRSVLRCLQLRPDDPRARYDLGLIAQREGRYNEAREAYLRALRADTHHRDARYNLALLTRGVGALSEARHHTEALLRAHPGDAEAQRLLLLLAHESGGASH